MLKVKDLHLGRVVLLNTPDNNNATNKNNKSEQQLNEKIGIIYKVDEQNETCCLIDCSKMDNEDFSLKEIVKDINNSSADHSKKYIQKEVPVTSIEMLPERLLLYTRKMSDVLKLLKNKETAASEENKFLVNARDTFNTINSKLSSKRDELSSVIQLDHINQKSWRLPRNYNYVFRILFHPCSKEEIEEDEQSKLLPFKETMAVAYARVVKGLRKMKQNKWVEIANLDGITYFAKGNMLIEVVMSQHNNPSNEDIKYIYSADKAKYSWETRLGADFLILVLDGKGKIEGFPDTIKHAVIDTAESHSRKYPGRYFYQLVPTNLSMETLNSTLKPEEMEWFSDKKSITEDMKIGNASLVKPGFETQGGGEFNFTKGHWRLTDKITAQIRSHMRNFNVFNGRNRIGVYHKHSVYEFSDRQGVRANRNGTAMIRSNKLVINHPLSVLIDFCLNGFLWKKYNENMANKSTIDILNLDSQDVATTYYDYAINNYKEILRKTCKLYDPEYSGIAKEKQNQLIENYQEKLKSYGRLKSLEWLRGMAAECYETYLMKQLGANKTSVTVPLEVYVQKQNLSEILLDLKQKKLLKASMEGYLDVVDECIVESIRNNEDEQEQETEELTVPLFYETIDERKFKKNYKGYRVVRLPSALIRLDVRKVASYWQSKQFLHNAKALVATPEESRTYSNHIKNLQTVEEIDLRGHKIECFPMKIEGTSEDFQNNVALRKKAKYLTLSHLSSLKILRLSKNLMVQMSTIFNTTLMYLDLSFNRLKKLPLLYCANLRVLDVSNNKLSGSLDAAMNFYSNPNIEFKILETLDLSGNKFTWEIEQVLSACSILRNRTPKLQNLMWHDNPFLKKYDSKKKLLLLRSTVCTSLPKLLAFSPPILTNEFQQKFPPLRHDYNKSNIYAWTKQTGTTPRRWHGAYLGRRKTKESLYDTFERDEAFRNTQERNALNFQARLLFDQILSECEKPAIENYMYRKMERGLIESGKDLLQWHDARTKRSHEITANEYDSQITDNHVNSDKAREGKDNEGSNDVNKYPFQWKMIKIMRKMNRINLKRAFFLWSKIATSQFYYLRLYSKERLERKLNSSLEDQEKRRQVYFGQQDVHYHKNIDKDEHLLKQITMPRLENLNKIINKFNGVDNVYLLFQKWKSNTTMISINARDIKKEYENQLSKRVYSMCRSASKYRYLMKRGFEKWKRTHVFNQIKYTTSEVHAAKLRIKNNQKQVAKLRIQMHKKIKNIDEQFAKVRDKLHEQDEQKMQILALKRQIALHQIESHSISNRLDQAKSVKPADTDGSILAQSMKGITRYI